MTSPARAAPGDFGRFVRRNGEAGGLVVQPRMGFGEPEEMRAGLAATRAARATTVGTITLDSYTRLGDLGAVRDALAAGHRLNGYPIASYPAATTQGVLAGLWGPDFPVQVRHGSPDPAVVFEAMAALGLDATEGGPVSYCLPYGRLPLARSVRSWAECTERFADLRGDGTEPHLETFGGCLLGQLCPPSLLVAVSVLEALFFHQHGVRSVSVSYAQQTDAGQDLEAVAALRRLCAEQLPVPNWHVVIYTFMGVYPSTAAGAYRLLGHAAELAVRSGSERLIVKTVAESRRIPTITENVTALEHAAATAQDGPTGPPGPADSETYAEAAALVEAVRNLSPDLGTALLRAFQRGYLDVPYCLHPDNRGRTRGYVDGDGRLRWAERGSLPLGADGRAGGSRRVTSSALLADLHYVRRKYDGDGAAVSLAPTGTDSVERADEPV